MTSSCTAFRRARTRDRALDYERWHRQRRPPSTAEPRGGGCVAGESENVSEKRVLSVYIRIEEAEWAIVGKFAAHRQD